MRLLAGGEGFVMRAFFHRLAPVGVMMLGLGASSAFSASSAIDPDPRAPTLGELLAREEAARVKVERVVEPAAVAQVPVAASGRTSAGEMPVGREAVRTGVRQVHPAFSQPAVTVLVPGGKIAR
jgi:hypothetical protein